MWNTLFINEQGKFSYTTITSVFGIWLAWTIIEFWKKEKVVDPYFLEWSQWVISVALGLRPAQKIGSSIIERVNYAIPDGYRFNRYGARGGGKSGGGMGGGIGTGGEEDEIQAPVGTGYGKAGTPSAGKSLTAQQKKFITWLYPIAREVEKKFGLSAIFIVAQKGFESGWGKSIIGRYNMGGVKATKDWNGATLRLLTWEHHKTDDYPYPKEDVVKIVWNAELGVYKYRVYRKFKDYASLDQALADYIKILQKPHFAHAWPHRGNPVKFVQQLQAGTRKYGTDVLYVEKMTKIINQIQPFVGTLNG